MHISIFSMACCSKSLYEKNTFSTAWCSEALYEKKQSIMTYEKETAKHQAQVEELEATSADKDNLIAKYEAIIKKSEGENIG